VKKVTLVLLTLTITLTAGWWRTYGGEGRDLGLCIQPTSDNNYIIVGRTSEYGSYTWLLKLNPNGDTIWTRIYQEIHPSWIIPTFDGGYIISGDVDYSPSVVKVDSNGGELWTRSYDVHGWGCVNYVDRTLDGGFILTGWATMSSIPEAAGLLLIKTDSLGDTLWTKLYTSYDWPDEPYGVGYCVKQASDGGYVVCGHTAGIGGPMPDVWLLKTDSQGDTLWTRRYGDYYDQEGKSLDITDDGGYIIVGYDRSPLWLLRTNSTGDTLWTQHYLGKGFGRGQGVLQTEDGGYIITGCTGISTIEGHAVLLLKTDESGNILWARTYADHFNDIGNVGYCVQETDDSGYIVVGGVHQRTESGDLYLLKTDSLGLLAVEEPVTPPVTQDWQVLVPVGREIVLMFNESSPSLTLAVYDASGRKVDELHVPQTGGTITWGEGYGPGVYFIREVEGSTTQKVILIR